jgi:hypothetical protein
LNNASRIVAEETSNEARQLGRAVGLGHVAITPGDLAVSWSPSMAKEPTVIIGIAGKPGSALICRVAVIAVEYGQLVRRRSRLAHAGKSLVRVGVALASCLQQTSRAKIVTDSVIETAGRGVTLEHDPLRGWPQFPEPLGKGCV